MPCTSLASPCTSCFASAATSAARWVAGADGGAVLRIDSVSEACQPKADGGDVWQVTLADSGAGQVYQTWRRVARSLGNGSYAVRLPRAAHDSAMGVISASILLTWSTDDVGFFDADWTQLSEGNQRFTATPAKVFRPCARMRPGLKVRM